MKIEKHTLAHIEPLKPIINDPSQWRFIGRSGLRKDLRQALERVHGFVTTSYRNGVNPLPLLRNCFDTYTWKFCRLQHTPENGPALSALFRKHDFVWPVGSNGIYSSEWVAARQKNTGAEPLRIVGDVSDEALDPLWRETIVFNSLYDVADEFDSRTARWKGEWLRATANTCYRLGLEPPKWILRVFSSILY